MKNNLLFPAIFAFLFSSTFSYAQRDWVQMMQDPTVNFYDVQKAFNTYYSKQERQIEKEKRKIRKIQGENLNEEEIEVPGFSQYKRWEWFMAPRVSATGERFAPDAAWKAMEEYRQQYGKSSAGNWTLMGPTTVAGLAGAGRIGAVRVHPTDPNTIFVCTPGGGLWKSTTGGTSWSTNTDWVSQVIGCSDVAIDPVNPNLMYLATGDGDHGDTYSVGLLKSTDAGATWNPTGLSFNLSQSIRISKILMHPTLTSTLILATSGGIYRSTDAGVTFTMVQAGSFKDMEFKPNDPNTVYASGVAFYKSTDNGVTWVNITSVLPAATCRMAIAVTPADANVVYLIAGLPAPGYGTEGFYSSSDAGANFTKLGAPNIGTQQWYDLCVASSPANKNEILLGGQTQFLKSTDGGTTWASSGSGTHVDYHDIIYTSGTTAYLTSDGGVWKSTNNGTSWTNLNKGLSIAEMYGFGQSTVNPNLNIQGWQDNGTARYNGTTWSSIMGGDGMLCFISWNNDQNMWGSQYSGSINKSTNGGASFSGCKGNITGTGAWVTPWIEDPVTANTIYAGFNDVWKHTGGGGTTGWTKISSFTGGATLSNMAVSPADNKVIWVIGGGNLYKTSDGGTTWTTLTNKPAGSIIYVACSKTDANKAWIAYSGYSSTTKIFQTNDQGATWINLSSTLPNIPLNCITVDKNGVDALYIGTDVGVFYKDASLSAWQSFSNKLPNVVVTQIEIFYPGNKVRASTFGRGMWESDTYSSPNSTSEFPSFMTDLRTFPNPTHGQFNLEMNISETNNYVIEIHNVIGAMVYKETLNSFKGTYCKPFDLSAYGKGMYTLSVTNSENRSMKKVIVY